MSEAVAACGGGGIPDGGAPIPSTCVTDVPCVDDAQCAAVAGTSCNTNTSRCQTVLCAADGVSCSSNAHCAGELACTSGRCSIRNYTYFISAWSIPANTDTHAVGVNLDGLNSTGECGTAGCIPTCTERTPDFLSASDPSEVGVDNAFGTLVPTLGSLFSGETLDDILSRQISSGDFLILLELTGVQSPVDDREVAVQLYTGRIPAGRTISDRLFDATPMGSPMSGSIARGQLRFSSPQLSVPIRAGDLNAALRIRATEWRVNLSSDRFATGVVGGAIDVRELAQTLAMSRPELQETLLDVLGGSADLMPSATDPTRCQSLSIGMSFIAEAAEISER